MTSELIVHRTTSSFLLCYVDHHDEAYDWAVRRRVEPHPTTGAAQLVEIRETVREIQVPRYVVNRRADTTDCTRSGYRVSQRRRRRFLPMLPTRTCWVMAVPARRGWTTLGRRRKMRCLTLRITYPPRRRRRYCNSRPAVHRSGLCRSTYGYRSV